MTGFFIYGRVPRKAYIFHIRSGTLKTRVQIPPRLQELIPE